MQDIFKYVQEIFKNKNLYLFSLKFSSDYCRQERSYRISLECFVTNS